MTDTRTLLERASDAAPEVRPDLEGVYERRARDARVARIRAGAVAGLIAIAGVAVGFNMLHLPGGAANPGAGSANGAPSRNIARARDDYYFQRFNGGLGRGASWWALDHRGRLDSS